MKRDSERQINWFNRQNQHINMQLKPTTTGDTDYNIDTGMQGVYSKQDSGIDFSISNNVLSSTVLGCEGVTETDQSVYISGNKHNVLTMILDQASNTNKTDLDIGTQTPMDVDKCVRAQQTCIPFTNSQPCQTVPAVHRKTQTLNFNSCFRRIQTMPIQNVNASTQSENPMSDSKQTMTLIVDQTDDGTVTMPLESRHVQTYMVIVEDKASGIDKSSTLSPHKNDLPPNCKSVRIQTNNPLEYLQTQQVHGQPYSDIWVQSATDFLLDNAAALASMKQTLQSLEHVCKEDERRQTSSVT